MNSENAFNKATLYFNLIGKKVKHLKKDKVKVVSRITAYQKKEDKWDVAVFFVRKTNKKNKAEPDCFLDKFEENYQVIDSE